MLTLEFSVTHGHFCIICNRRLQTRGCDSETQPLPFPSAPFRDKSWSLRHYITGLSTMYLCLLPAPTRHERAGKGTIAITPVNRCAMEGWMDGMGWRSTFCHTSDSTVDMNTAPTPPLKHLETSPNVSAECTAAVISTNYRNVGRGGRSPTVQYSCSNKVGDCREHRACQGLQSTILAVSTLKANPQQNAKRPSIVLYRLGHFGE
jgi:hypothetical protein